MAGLESRGFRHVRMLANDGGISLGQAMVAGTVLRHR
jgi:hydrogenase maturation factor HypF (carbamoyltransferase family)